MELEDDMITFKSDFVETTPPDYVEAPWMLKRGGTYYLLYSVGGVSLRSFNFLFLAFLLLAVALY